MSEETAKLVDAEIKRLVTDAYKGATQLLTEHRADWEKLAEALIEYETLSGDEIKDLLAGKPIDKEAEMPVPEEKRTGASVPEM
jgi:cell division protease FtsH